MIEQQETQKVTTAAVGNRLGIASLLVAVGAIAGLAFGSAAAAFVLAVVGIGLSVGAATQTRNGTRFGYWVAALIICAGVLLILA